MTRTAKGAHSIRTRLERIEHRGTIADDPRGDRSRQLQRPEWKDCGHVPVQRFQGALYSHGGIYILKTNALTLEWTLGKPRRALAKDQLTGSGATAHRPGKLPRLTRLMALAIKFEGLVVHGEVRDYADLARLGHVTRARITQIMNLLNLSPDIQEQILLLPASRVGRDLLSERGLRKLASIANWGKQRRAWSCLRRSKDGNER